MRHGNPVPQRRGGTDDGQRGTGLAPQARVAGCLVAEAVVSKAKANEGVHPHAGRRSIAQSPVRRQRPRRIALSPDRHMARLQHYTSEQPQNACLINDRYGGVRTACTRSEKQRCASAKAITAHHRQAGRELFLGRLERECIQSARGKVSRSAATQQTPNQQAPGGMLASVSWASGGRSR